MSEVAPAFTYSPEGILTIARGDVVTQLGTNGGCGIAAKADQGLETARDTAVEWLGGLPGVEVQQAEGPDQVIIPVATALEAAIARRDETQMSTFLNTVWLLQSTANGSADKIDRVMTTPQLGSKGVRAHVYHHFQGWLNQVGLTEGAALDCLVAMAVPFDRVTVEAVEADFSFDKSLGAVAARSRGSEVRVDQEEFGFMKFTTKRLGQTRRSLGRGKWQGVGLSTYGNSDCGIGINPDTREHIRLDPDSKKLYPMQAHNMYGGPHALSMFLGLGSLAHHATEYPGTKDVFADVTWDKPKKWRSSVPSSR